MPTNSNGSESGRPIVVFDVNETLLDLTTLEPLFERPFGNASYLREWFAQLILYSQTMTLSGLYTPFGSIAVGSLTMMAAIHKVEVTSDDIDEMKQLMGSMPAHPDVVPALDRLQTAGFTMVTLTNSAITASPTPLEKAGIDHYFEQTFSVESARKFKPAVETYELVANALDTPASNLCLVACHLWDTIGAQAAGGYGALIKRPYNEVLVAPEVPAPDIVSTDLDDLAMQITQRWQVQH